MSLSTLLDAYTLTEILEMNDLTEEELLEFLVRHHMVTLPEVKPLDFDETP